MNFWSQPIQSLRAIFGSRKPPRVLKIRGLYSPILERDVDFDVYLPPDYRYKKMTFYPLLVVNDGQDLPRADYENTLEWLWREKRVPSFVTVGIYANSERIKEYGTTRQADYKGRGRRAPQYNAFIFNELMPYLYGRFRLTGTSEERAIAGFSLGGLSAFDIGWGSPETFGTVGVFSGALWWRWSKVKDEDPDADRIMHDIVQKSEREIGDQYFWFQTGTLDEPDDRNNNGVIDAIDDTLDLIRELKNKDCHDGAIRYLEIENGTHDPQTWGSAMPDFLIWTFGGGKNFEES